MDWQIRDPVDNDYVPWRSLSVPRTASGMAVRSSGGARGTRKIPTASIRHENASVRDAAMCPALTAAISGEDQQ